MHRRDLLKAAATFAPLVIAGRALAAPAAGSGRLLLVFLRGAYNAANIVAPVGNDFYNAARPTIALTKPDPAGLDAALVLALDGDWALHPALRDSLYPLWQAKQVAFVPFAGTDDMSRSHFETQDTIELGQSISGSRDLRSGLCQGWTARSARTSRSRFPIRYRSALKARRTGRSLTSR